MFPIMPMPVDRVVTPPNTDKIKQEDDEQARRADDAKKAPPKEPFDAHLGRVLPPGWSPTTQVQLEAEAQAEMASSVVPFQGAGVKPSWLMKALGDLPDTAPVEAKTQVVALHVNNAPTIYHANEILDAVKEGAPIHEAHFPSLFAAQFTQMQVKGEPISKLSVQIAPEHLGQLQMTFTLQQQTVAVSVLAANHEAKEALDRQLGAIQNILQTHNLKPAEIKVEVASQGSQSNGGQFSGEQDGYQAPNRWLMKRGGDLDEGIDVTVG